MAFRPTMPRSTLMVRPARTQPWSQGSSTYPATSPPRPPKAPKPRGPYGPFFHGGGGDTPKWGGYVGNLTPTYKPPPERPRPIQRHPPIGDRRVHFRPAPRVYGGSFHPNSPFHPDNAKKHPWNHPSMAKPMPVHGDPIVSKTPKHLYNKPRRPVQPPSVRYT